MSLQKPAIRPERPEFSSGPCVKRPGWSPVKIARMAFLGRSHRSIEAKKQLKDVIEITSRLLKIPDDYLLGIVPASDTGAYEMAIWAMLGALPVDILVWESFGKAWALDIVQELKVRNFKLIESGYGEIPDLSLIRDNSDVCFVWNGTTSGACVPDADWIKENRRGLTFCDATSAVFAKELDWKKLDVTTFSWQKVMGGEAAHGMVILSPRAIKRLKEYKPNRPLPKIFKLIKNGELSQNLFQGETINTPSMLCVADALDSLLWIEEIGGLKSTVERANSNFGILQDWVDEETWVENLVKERTCRSNTSVCLKLVAPEFKNMDKKQQMYFIEEMVKLLEAEKAAYDIKSHRDAPPGLRIWCGATVNAQDLRALLPWLKWAYERTLLIVSSGV